MAKLERLTRNGSGKENLVAKYPGREKCRREVNYPTSGSSCHWIKILGFKSDVGREEFECYYIASSTSKQCKYWWKRFEEFCSDNGRQIEPFSDLTKDGCDDSCTCCQGVAGEVLFCFPL